MSAAAKQLPKKGRKHLSADSLHLLLRRRFEGLIDQRREASAISLADAMMSAFAMFSLKDPSLLAFDQRRQDENMKRLFQINRVPSDTYMREMLDVVEPVALRPAFRDVFRELQRGKVLNDFKFLDQRHLLLMDGTGYFSSEKIHCSSCLKKEHKDGRISYAHQMLSAVIAHPDHRAVMALAPEPIGNHDGSSKNDCERNAAVRLLRHIRAEHPHLDLIVVEDGLASNAPHIRAIQALRMHFLLGAKPGDHVYLYDRLQEEFDHDRVKMLAWQQGVTDCVITYVNGLPLNAANPELLVNFLGYTEYDATGNVLKRFSWVTDLKISAATRTNWCVAGARVGRSRMRRSTR